MRARKPVLTEERLTQMNARAARIYKGESAPSVNCAEDILYLVAEVRELRQRLMEEQSLTRETGLTTQSLKDPSTNQDLGTFERYFQGMDKAFKEVFGGFKRKDRS